MATLLDSIPATLAKKVGEALFKEHKGKIEGVIGASKATEKELRDPDKLTEWLGLPTAGSVGTKTVTVGAMKKKLKITITLVDYDKIKKALDNGNKWFKSLEEYDPVPEVNKRKKAAEAGYIAYGKSVFKAGVSDPATVKLAEKALPPIGKLNGELQDLVGYYSACKSVFPKHQKVFAGYVDIFESSRKIFERILNEIPLTPELQAEVFVHHNNCEQLRSRCQTARDHCKKIAAKSKAHHKAVDGYRMLMETWLGHLAKTLVPATLKKIAGKTKPAIKSYISSFNKLFGG